MNPNFQDDIDAIQQIPSVQSILDIIRKTTGMGFAAVARVTDEYWVACAVDDGISFGLLPGGQLELKTTICHEIHQHGQAVIIDRVSADTSYANHHTPRLYGFESYISMPIRLQDGSFFGTLCAIDPNPADLSIPHIREMFSLFANLIGQALDKVNEAKKLNDELKEEKKIATFREQFIAIVGHDLRNPLTTSLAGIQALIDSTTDNHSKKIAGVILNSNRRMRDLLDNLMDFTEGQLGTGLSTNKVVTQKIPEIIGQIVSEQKMSSPATEIITDIDINKLLQVDEKRFSQLFTNLLVNAITHGLKGSPIKIKVVHADGILLLSIKNATDPVSEEKLQKIFHPYVRGEKATTEGLGLGLFIASQIAKAHGGSLTANYADGEIEFSTRFAC